MRLTLINASISFDSPIDISGIPTCWKIELYLQFFGKKYFLNIGIYQLLLDEI